MSKDLVGVVESVYRLRGTDDVWLSGVLDALQPHVDRGLGILGYLFDARVTPRLDVQRLVSHGIADAAVAQMSRMLAAMQGPDVRMKRVFALQDGCSTASEIMGSHFSSMPGLDHLVRMTPFRDFFSMVAADPGGIGCIINVPLPTRDRTDVVIRRRWGQVSAHIAAALRLRRALAALGKRETSTSEAAVEAVLTPAGRTLHAEGVVARGSVAREQLEVGVRRRERARGAFRRISPDEALAAWWALIAGRWTLLDHVEANGQRLVLARRNDASAPAVPHLTVPQAQVVGFALLGHSNKLIAYELGIRESTVAMRLQRACRMLGVRSRIALITKVRQVLGEGS